MPMNNMLDITLPIHPVGKQRSRQGPAGNWYNPQNRDILIIKRIIKEKLPENFVMIKKDVPVIVNIVFFFHPTKSEITKSFMKKIENEDYPYLKKPDRDNADKFVLDCFSKLVFYDDNQIYDGRLTKFYTPYKSRIEIEVMW
jgi:Holliday junction resolvase RusA-like endonuclease